DEFRSLALALDGAIEAEHMDHPDFRVGGKIFATLGYPDAEHGMVNLTPETQRTLLRQMPAAFSPCSGKWGESGATHVRLAAVTPETVRGALEAAWQKVRTPPKRKR
ncbi:MAG TPA: MmcQ/YjbR family DNA-binding protein, partial [Opitutaceae bacterium]|nr:MmcQ/YjbR family DNA-binding protein [Opitutaceae bacterium]